MPERWPSTNLDLRWLRVVGDAVFLAGAGALWLGRSCELKPSKAQDRSGTAVPSVAGD